MTRLKIFTSFFLLILIFPQLLYSQENQQTIIKTAKEYLEDRGEVYFRFNETEKHDIQTLSKLLSISNRKDGYIYAYANKNQYKKIAQLNIELEILLPPSLQAAIKRSKTRDNKSAWESYPTYEEYVLLMQNFAINYPNLCKLDTIGDTKNGRKILAVKISDNVTQKEAEPEFFYTSTMHGDETGGYILMLHLADYLLSEYSTNPQVQNLVDNIEIWINPLFNPDGTYYGGNNSVYNSRRGNANNIDLNRNFPDPSEGDHPDGNLHQPETLAMMEFMSNHNFTLSANFHAGAEVVNYPWDTWWRRHADDSWFHYISRQYADTARYYSPSWYLNASEFDKGVTNGYDWYQVYGGRQDYMTHHKHGREITIELDETFITPENKLNSLWEYNYRSFLNYMQQSLYGIRGIITDATSGEPIKAKIEVVSHDKDSSSIYSNSRNGNYHRMIYEGTYDLKVSASGYFTKYINNVNAINNQTTILDIELDKSIVSVIDNKNSKLKLDVYPNPVKEIIHIDFTTSNYGNVEIKLLNILGNQISVVVNKQYNAGHQNISVKTIELQAGVYFLSIKAGNIHEMKRFVVY